MNPAKKSVVNGLGVLQVLIGLGAVGGGAGLVLAPHGDILGLPVDLLRNSPFSTYLVPGLVLLAVNGLGSLAGATVTFKQHRWAGAIAMGLGAFLVAWILLQVYWLATFHWAHGLYLGLGILELVLGGLLRRILQKKRVPDGRKNH